MKTSAYMAVLSHLSDAQELIAIGFLAKAQTEINFVKYLLSKAKDNLQEEYTWEELDEICAGSALIKKQANE